MRSFNFLSRKTLGLLAVLLLLSIATSALASSPTFQLNPAAISNTYSGTVSLQVTGLTTGEAVVVLGYLDANTNSVVDASDLLVQAYKIVDNQATVFGGVTNLGVPGDLNPANGAITYKIPAANLGVLPQFCGNFLYVLSSPSNNFTAITNQLVISNYNFPQSISGSLTCNGTNVPYGAVTLFHFSGNNLDPVSGAVANSLGNYTIKAPPGNYLMLGIKSNFVANTGTSPMVTLGNGASISTNVPMTAATTRVSGTIVQSNSVKGVPGQLVPITSSSGLLAVGWGDTNGNFSIPVTSDIWKVNVDSRSPAFHNYLEPQNSTQANTTTGSVSGVTISLPQASAMFYGTIIDALGNPLPGVSLYSEDNSGNYESSTSTDANGRFFLGAFSGGFNMSVDSQQVTASNYVFNSQGLQTNLSNGQAVQQNISARLAAHVITGHVRDSGNTNIASVGMYGVTQINGTNFYALNSDTDSSGNYTLNVCDGVWFVGVNCNGGNNSLSSLGYGCVADQSTTISSNNQVLNFTVPGANQYQLTGRVTDLSSAGVSNLPVIISGNNSSQTNVTDSQGYYSFIVADGNSYSVYLACSNVINLGYSCPASQIVNISGADGNADFILQPPSIQITSPLASGTVGIYYSQQLQVTGGSPPYTWNQISGNLPQGLQLATNGVLSGTPTQSGSFSFTAQVSDYFNDTAIEQFSLTISNSPPRDIGAYYVIKQLIYRQTNSSSPAGNLIGGAGLLGLFQTTPSSVINANGILPNGTDFAFPPGGSSMQLLTFTNFPNQSSMDASFSTGSYAFIVNGITAGLQFYSLTVPSSSNYPPVPVISNFNSFTNVAASSSIPIQWAADTGGASDGVLFAVNTLGGSNVFSTPIPFASQSALNGLSTGTVIPANTLQPATSYNCYLAFVRQVSTTPNGMGIFELSSETAFTLTTLSANSPPPRLTPLSYSKATGFSLTLSGTLSKTYIVQVSSNLTTWSNVQTTNLISSPITLIDSQATNLSRRFYRAQQQGP